MSKDAGETRAGAGSRSSVSGRGSGATAALTRSSGLTKRKPTFRKVAGQVTEETGLTLDDFIAFVTELEGKAPDMDEVMENALDALFRRAKGFVAWRKSRLSAPVGDDEIEGALASLGAAESRPAGASSGARASR